MTIWAIWDGDYGGDWIVAAFTTEELARAYFSQSCQGYDVRPIEVLDALPEREANHGQEDQGQR